MAAPVCGGSCTDLLKISQGQFVLVPLSMAVLNLIKQCASSMQASLIVACLLPCQPGSPFASQCQLNAVSCNVSKLANPLDAARSATFISLLGARIIDLEGDQNKAPDARVPVSISHVLLVVISVKVHCCQC